MAYVAPYVCAQCGEQCTEIVPRDHVCSVCRDKKANAVFTERAMYLRGLTALTVEERLARLEAAAYDVRDLKRRIEALEAANARY